MASVHFSSSLDFYLFVYFFCRGRVSHCNRNRHWVQKVFRGRKASLFKVLHPPVPHPHPDAVLVSLQPNIAEQRKKIQGTDDHQMNKYHSRISIKSFSMQRWIHWQRLQLMGVNWLSSTTGLRRPSVILTTCWHYVVKFAPQTKKAEHLLPRGKMMLMHIKPKCDQHHKPNLWCTPKLNGNDWNDFIWSLLDMYHHFCSFFFTLYFFK